MERTRLLVGLYFFAVGLVIYLPIFIAHNLTSCLVYSPNGGGLVKIACPPISNDALITEYMGWFCALGGLAFALSTSSEGSPSPAMKRIAKLPDNETEP